MLAVLQVSAISTKAQVWNRPTTSSPIAISRNDRLIWVVNPSDDSVSVLRPDTNTRLAKISVGDELESITLAPDGRYAYVANAAGSSVSVIQINDPALGYLQCKRHHQHCHRRRAVERRLFARWTARLRCQQRAGQHHGD
jgi:YVTN family beta-propeller protein